MKDRNRVNGTMGIVRNETIDEIDVFISLRNVPGVLGVGARHTEFLLNY